MNVSCGLKLININKIDSKDFSFTVNVAFFFSWLDNRVEIFNGSENTINLDLQFLEKIWTPDFYIYDLLMFRHYFKKHYN